MERQDCVNICRHWSASGEESWRRIGGGPPDGTAHGLVGAARVMLCHASRRCLFCFTVDGLLPHLPTNMLLLRGITAPAPSQQLPKAADRAAADAAGQCNATLFGIADSTLDC
jgi:hypothetical protein